MGWKRINSAVEMLEKPCLGTIKLKQGKRFMALCVDPSSKKGKYIGLARQVINREGNVDIPGYVDKSKLLIVKSCDLLSWEIVSDLKIEGIEQVLDELGGNGKEFIGLEDPDILIDKKGVKHVYFTIPFKHKTKSINDVVRYDVYVGHAEGTNLNWLLSTEPVLGRVNDEIVGFKEICLVTDSTNIKTFLAETFVFREHGKSFSAIGVAKAEKLNEKWTYQRLAHNPEKEEREWCQGHSSPCKILPREMIDFGESLRVLILNGRAPTRVIKGKKHYGDFIPGLALYNPQTGEISWVSEKPLFKDPDSTGITFASEVVPFDKESFILYAHVNDSFVRAYRIKYKEIKRLLPRKT